MSYTEESVGRRTGEHAGAADGGGAASSPTAASSGAGRGQHRLVRGDEAEEDVEDGSLATELVAQSSEQVTARKRRAAVIYLVYCSVCFSFTCALLLASLVENWASGTEGRFWRRRLRPWEEAGEAFVGGALCTETFLSVRYWKRHRLAYRGSRRIFWDCWRIFDACVAGLTFLLGILFLLRRLVDSAEAIFEDFDVPILGLRFALQPFRMGRTTSMVVKAVRVAAREPRIKAPTILDPRMPCPELSRQALTPVLASQIREMLPPYLQYADWRLVYSPQVHGTSFKTFFRRQAGPNVLVVRDAHGGLFGGFATEPWRPEVGAYGGTGEAFVWEAPSVEDEQGVKAYWAVPARGRVVQWSTPTMLGLGKAIVVCDEFLRGSSNQDQTFGIESSLSPAGVDFVVRDFECWHVGGSAADSDQE